MNHQQAVDTLAAERYLLDEMSEQERDTYEEHYFSCLDCADDLRTGGLMRDAARAGLLPDEPGVHALAPGSARVVPFRPRSWYRSAVMPWAAAATLAVVAGYQTLVVVPALRPLNEPRALAPITLRPAARGEEPKIAIGADSAAITLALDIGPAAAGAELPYDLRTAAGAAVASGRARASSSGAPLLLFIPSRDVRAPGHYVLSIAGDEYRFEVVAQ
jgi:hypothetical protein